MFLISTHMNLDSSRALAIHDTANVIGTALIFDRESSEVATTLKTI